MTAKHAFRAPQTGSPEGVEIHSTEQRPWTKRRRNRLRNKIARASRKRNWGQR